MPNVEVELKGDWQQTHKAMALLPQFVMKLQHNVASGISDEYFEALRGHLQSQDLPLEPLKAWYREWKAERGLDTRILIATGQMFDTIRQYPVNHGKTFVGIKHGTIHRESGLDVALMALALEYGDPLNSLPARPAYRLTVEELKDKLQEVLTGIVKKTRIEVFGR